MTDRRAGGHQQGKTKTKRTVKGESSDGNRILVAIQPYLPPRESPEGALQRTSRV